MDGKVTIAKLNVDENPEHHHPLRRPLDPDADHVQERRADVDAGRRRAEEPPVRLDQAARSEPRPDTAESGSRSAPAFRLRCSASAACRSRRAPRRRDRASRRSGCAAACRSSFVGDPVERRRDVARPARPTRPGLARRAASSAGSRPASEPAPARCRRAGEAREGPEEADRVLGVEHAGDRGTSGRGARSSRSAIASAMTMPGAGIVAAVEPDLGVGAGARDQRARRSARCSRAGQSTLARPASIAAAGSAEPGAPERGDRRAGIGELVAAGQPRRAAGRGARPRPGRPAARARHRRPSRDWRRTARRADARAPAPRSRSAPRRSAAR